MEVAALSSKPSARRVDGGHFPQTIHHQEGLPGELALAAAVIRQVIIDIKQRRPSTRKVGGWLSIGEQLAAVEWICDAQAVGFWADLLGLDGPWLQEQLLAAAGLTASLQQKGHS